MNITTFKKCLPYILKAKITPWLWGFHGRGKSQVIEGIFKEIGWLCFNFRLGTQADVGDLLGQAEIVRDPVTGEFLYTKFHMPEWLHNAIEFCKANPDKGAVIFLDELNRIFRQDLIPPVFQMALDYRLHTYEFPSNLHVIVAGNPDTSNYKVIKFRDEAFYDRFCHIKFDPSVEEWFKYANKRKFSSDILGFLQEQPEFLEQTDLEDFSIAQYISPGRRSWEAVQRLYDIDTPDDIRREISTGLVGASTVAAWKDHLDKGGKPISPEDILDNYSEVRDEVLKYSDFSSGTVRGDILKVTCDNLAQFLIENYSKGDQNSKSDKKLEPIRKQNLTSFMHDVPKEVLFDFGVKTGKDCVEVINILMENRELLALIKEAKGE